MSTKFPLVAGMVAAIGLLAFYLALITLAEGRDFAARQFRADWPYLIFLMPSFGWVIGMILHAQERVVRHSGVMAGSTGMSATAVVACCAHFLPTLLPLVGISTLASVLAAWKVPLLLLAIATNLAVVAYVWRHIRSMDRMEALL
jgi:hypothetical protein